MVEQIVKRGARSREGAYLRDDDDADDTTRSSSGRGDAEIRRNMTGPSSVRR